jgi:hypothetical protein
LKRMVVRDFVVINTCDISEDDFIYFKDKFKNYI